MPLVDHSSAVTGLPWAASTVKNSAATPLSEAEGDKCSGDLEAVLRKIGGSRGSTGLWMDIRALRIFNRSAQIEKQK